MPPLDAAPSAPWPDHVRALSAIGQAVGIKPFGSMARAPSSLDAGLLAFAQPLQHFDDAQSRSGLLPTFVVDGPTGDLDQAQHQLLANGPQSSDRFYPSGPPA